MIMIEMQDEHTWVFLSHSNKDFGKLVLVRNRLEELNYRPLLFFLKCLDDHNEIMELIKREIDARERFILCESHNSKASSWVKEEVAYIKASGRPYEVIDLDASQKVIHKSIDRFDRRSTLYIWSTEGAVEAEVAELSRYKAFKVNVINGNNLSGASLARTAEDVLEESGILKGAYFLALVSRKLNEEEASSLNSFAKRFHMNAVAFCIDNHIDNNGYWNGLKDSIFRKKTIKDVDNANLAKKIVDDLMDWDKKLFGGETADNKKPEERPRIDKKAFAKRLRDYIAKHREGTPLKPIDKPSHKTWLEKSGCTPGTQKDYLRRLNLKKFMDLINSHASKKDLYYPTIYDCTDLEVLLSVFEELLATDKKGSMSSALYYYIVHLLEANGIFIR